MKKKIVYLFITAVISTTAFLIGASTRIEATAETTIPDGYIPMETAIPVSDIACWYVNNAGCISVDLKDITYQLDDKTNASYTDVLIHVPRMLTESEIGSDIGSDMLDLNSVSDYETNENVLTLYTNTGDSYVIEK